MIKLRLAVVAAIAGLFMMTSGSLAHAAVDPYPAATPKPTQSVAPDDDALAPDDADLGDDNNGVLPGTGGASLYILLAGGALLLVGGGVVYATRSRQQTAH